MRNDQGQFTSPIPN